ncbi:class I SAM-dependent methyltransferase [Thiorhodococcus drewsii]|nr:class I SAM-dependent methyltransferase [Thiorhodococcus drewsii]
MNWKQLLVKKALIGRIPFIENIRLIKRKIFGYPPNTDNLELTLKHYERIKSSIEQSNKTIKESIILEIGSGWFPTIPILLARDGAKRIFMSDLNVHMDNITFSATSDYLKNRFPNDEFVQKIENIAPLPIEYLAPFDSSILPDKTLDLVISRTVLEHIPKNDIYTLFSSLRRKISERGIMVHLIDHSDHFEHHDKSISKLNFLTWSEEKHALINFLARDGENRMRHHEYHQIFVDSGFEVIGEETDLHKETMEKIKELELVYPYSLMLPEQLAILTSIYILKPA